MCMSAIQQARISKVYYGVENKDSINSDIINMISRKSNTNPPVELYGGFLQSEITLLLTAFLKKKREKQR